MPELKLLDLVPGLLHLGPGVKPVKQAPLQPEDGEPLRVTDVIKIWLPQVPGLGVQLGKMLGLGLGDIFYPLVDAAAGGLQVAALPDRQF